MNFGILEETDGGPTGRSRRVQPHSARSKESPMAARKPGKKVNVKAITPANGGSVKGGLRHK